MTNEEWNRKTEFLLNQQAKFDAGMQELKEAQAISEQKIAKAAEAAEHALEGVSQLTDITAQLITTTTAGFRKVFEHMKHTDQKIDVLVNSQILTEESLRQTVNLVKDTNERLGDLTDLFRRHISEDHRGRNGSEN
jgi:hypothetical protein